MLQLLPSFSRLSLGSLSRRHPSAPTGADGYDYENDKEAARASELLVMLSQGSAPGPSQPGPSQPASLTEAQMKERESRLSKTPGAVAARRWRGKKREQEEKEGNLQPTARKRNPNLGNNVPWLEEETLRLRSYFDQEMARTNGKGPINYKWIWESFNEGKLEEQQRNLEQIKGKLRQWTQRMKNIEVSKEVWTDDEVKRLLDIDEAVDKRADQMTDVKEILRRYNEGLPEAYRRDKDSLARKLRHLKNPRVRASART